MKKHFDIMSRFEASFTTLRNASTCISHSLLGSVHTGVSGRLGVLCRCAVSCCWHSKALSNKTVTAPGSHAFQASWFLYDWSRIRAGRTAVGLSITLFHNSSTEQLCTEQLLGCLPHCDTNPIQNHCTVIRCPGCHMYAHIDHNHLPDMDAQTGQAVLPVCACNPLGSQLGSLSRGRTHIETHWGSCTQAAFKRPDANSLNKGAVEEALQWDKVKPEDKTLAHQAGPPSAPSCLFVIP